MMYIVIIDQLPVYCNTIICYIHDVLKLNYDFICNIVYSFNVIRLIHDYIVTQ